MLSGAGDCLQTAVNAHFPEQVLDVVAHGDLTDAQDFGHARGRMARRQQAQDFHFAGG